MTDSFYLTRLKNFYERNNSPKKGDTNYTRQVRTGYLTNTAEVRYSDISYIEEEYKGHQLIIKREELDWAFVLENGQPLICFSDEAKALSERGEWNTIITYQAYAWKIKDLDLESQTIRYLGEDTLISGHFATNSLKQTTSKAKKRIDIESTLLDHKLILNELANNGVSILNTTTPYNLKVNDWVWIQAHGRMRNGIIVGTEGRRFIVGYTTPSNPETMKYKILNLSQIFIVEGDLIETQAHNFVKIGA
jgi:hypothetical protein